MQQLSFLPGPGGVRRFCAILRRINWIRDTEVLRENLGKRFVFPARAALSDVTGPELYLGQATSL
jgi:hypothetical protein